MLTKLRRITELSQRDCCAEFRWLMPHFNRASLIECYHELDGKKAVGTDGITKEEYGQDLNRNIDNLLSRMKTMSYRPKPVRQVMIPKDDGKGGKRPLGISCFEDKIVQLMASKVLEAIYEPIFHDNSYGFRPGRSCHTAITSLTDYLHFNWVETVMDIDLKNFFGTMDHKKLIQLLSVKVKDKTFLRYITRMLKSGIFVDGSVVKTEEGSPQGSVVSPILANIYAHYALDEWINNIVKKHVRRPIEMFRYCDDIVICCRYKSDAQRIQKAIKKRVERFSLELNSDKTRLVNFSQYAHSLGQKQESFDYLGFTFYIGKSNKGKTLVKLKTSKKRTKSKLSKVKQWIKSNRHKAKMRTLWDRFCIKVSGHIRYYGVSHNYWAVRNFLFKATHIFFKWINRRSGRKSITWENFSKYVNKYPLPKNKVYLPLFQGKW